MKAPPQQTRASRFTAASLSAGIVGWLGVIVLFAQPGAAADYTWTGASGATWNTTSTNWTPSATTPWDSSNGAGNTAIFTNTSGNLTISGTNFANRVNSTGTSGTFDIAGTANALSLTGTTPTIDVASGGTLSISARLLGDFTKSGSGTLTLNPLSPLARAGNTTLSGGVLNVSHHQALGTNTTTVGAGTTLNFTFTNNTVNGAVLTGSGTINSSVPTTGTSGAAYNFADMSSFTGTWNIGQTNSGGVGRVQLSGGALNSAATFNVRSNITLWDSTGTSRGANVILNGGDTAESIGQLRLNNGGTWTGAVTIAGAMTGANDAHIGVFGGNATVSGSISGSPTLSLFSTSGQWIALSGSNTHTGDTILSQSSATLQVANANALQSSTLAGSLGAVQFSGISSATFGGLKDSRNLVLTNTAGAAVTLVVGNNGQSTTYGGSLSGSGVLRKTGAGTLTLTGANTHGNTEIREGALQINTGGSVIAARSTWVGTVGTGALNINGGTYSNVNVNVGHLGGTGTVNLSSGSLLAQNLTVGGNDSAAGTLNLNGGTVGVSGNFNVGTNGTINVNSGGVLSGGSGGNLYATNANSVVKFNGGTGSASLNLYVGNGGAVDLNGQSIATNTWAYLVTDNAGGVLRNSSTNAATIASNNPIWIRAGTNLIVDASSGNIQINSLISGFGTTNASLTKTGSNALILTVSTNDYGGGTTLSAGTLRVGANGALGTGGLTMSNGTVFASDGATARTITNAVTMGGDVQLGDATGTGALTLSNIDLGTATRTLTVSNTTTVAGAMTNAGGLAKAGSGTLALTASNTYTGGTTVSAGTLELGNGGSVAGNITNNAALSINRTDSSTLSNAISGSGQLTKSGAGTAILSASNSYGGGTTLSAGTLRAGANGALGTGALTINAGTFASDGATARTITNAVTMGGDVQLGDATGTGALTLSNIDLGTATRTLTVSNTTTVAGAITNTGGLTKAGGGTLALTASNTYTGGTTISAGTLEMGNGGSVAGNITNNATLSLNRTDSSTLSNAVSGTGALSKSGAGTVTLSASNSYGGGLVLNDGTLRVGNNNALGTGALTINAGTFASDGATARTITNAIAMGGNLQLGDATGTGALTLSNIDLGTATRTMTVGVSTAILGVLSGDGGLTKDAFGQLTLAGANSYAGTTTVSQGTLVVSHSTALGGAGGGTVVASGAQLRLSNNVTINEALTISGLGFVNASATSTNAGALRNASGNNTWAGKVTLADTARVFVQGTGLTFADEIDLQNNTLLIEHSTSSFVAANGVIKGTGGIVKLGSGTTTLSGISSYSGATVVSNGFLVAGAAAGGQAFGNLSAVTLSAGGVGLNPTALNLNNFNQTIGSLAGGGTDANGGSVTLGSGTLTTGGNNTSTTFAGLISGTGGLVKTGTGTQTLTGANTYSGGTLVSAGALSGNTTSLQGNITNNASVIFDQNGSGTYANVLSGSGVLTKIGSGTLTLSALNTYSGGTLLNGGWLTAGHTNAFGTGSITVGSGTTLNLTNFAVGNQIVNNGGTILSTGTLSDVTATNGTTDIGGNNSTVAEVGGSATINVSGSGVTVNQATGGTLNVSGSSARVATLSGGTVNANAAGLVVTNFNGGNITISNGVTVGLRGGSSSGVISGSGGMAKQGADTLTLSANNTYTGATTVEAGKLVVNGSISSATTVQSGASLGGSGTIASATIQSGGTIDPGNSPGTLTLTNGLTWSGGGNYNWQIFGVSGTAGATNTWDLIAVTGGTWDINGLSSTNKFNINLWSLSGLPETSGPLAGFDATQNYSWKIVDSVGITGSFNTNFFNINTSAVNGTDGFVGATGLFSLELNSNDLFLTYTGTGGAPIPEPGTWAAGALLLLGAGYLRWRRRSLRTSW